jgi:hypothetical protein
MLEYCMQDDRELIKARLGKLGIRTRREDEITRELSDHLEDHTAALEADGVARDEAGRRAFNSVANWPALRSEILLAEAAEEIMNYRTKVLWLPAFCALTLSSALLALFQFFGMVPRFFWLSNGMSMETYFTVYAPWLIALAAVGALAALWSKRAGGEVIHRLLAALAPAIGFLGFMLVSPFIVVLVYELLRFYPGGGAHRRFPLNFSGPFFAGIAVLLVSWVLLPALPLLLGAVPFLRRPQRQS